MDMKKIYSKYCVLWYNIKGIFLKIWNRKKILLLWIFFNIILERIVSKIRFKNIKIKNLSLKFKDSI